MRAQARAHAQAQAGCRELTRALLQRDFQVTWDMPAGNLVPPVPNRANYLHWLNDLLGLSAPPGERDSLLVCVQASELIQV